MSTTVQRTLGSNPHERHSLFLRDLASPISAHIASRFSIPCQAALWRENFSTSDDPLPPPVFTLEDGIDFSPEPALHELPTPPPPQRNYFLTPSPIRMRAAEGSRNGMVEKSVGSGSWWAPQGSKEKEKGSAVDGTVKPGALIMFPPPSKVARPEMKRSQLVPARDGMMMDEEEWVTIYGFSPGDTNLVIRGFEECGVILKHIPGPKDANWMHILYQSRYDAQKALGKNGMQLNGALIIGVKPMDPAQRRYLNERLTNTHEGFMVSLSPQSTAGRSAALSPVAASPCPRYLQNRVIVANDGGPRPTGAIASPAKSVVTRVMDFMFGF